MYNTEYAQVLISLFSDAFMDTYNQLNKKETNLMTNHMHSLYRRWYYATLIEGVQFSPANLIEALDFYTEELEDDTHITVSMHKKSLPAEFIHIHELNYNISNHPIIEDLRILMEICTPYIDLSEIWCFSNNQATKVSQKLSQSDPYYAAYLLEMATRLGILERVATINVQRMEVSQQADDILNQPCENILRELVNITAATTSAALQSLLPAPIAIFSTNGLVELLKKPMPTNELYRVIFQKLGYDADEMIAHLQVGTLQTDPQEIEDTVAGVYNIGVLLDRLFFTPLSSFLRIVRPLYDTPYDLEADIMTTLETCAMEDFGGFFAPCASFALTNLGLELFDIQNADAYQPNYESIISVEILMDILKSSKKLRSYIKTMQKTVPLSLRANSVYTFAIHEKDCEEAWIHIKIPRMFTLNHLFSEVADAFCIFDPEGSYCFYLGQKENIFTKYTNENSVSQPQKTKRSQTLKAKSTNTALEKIDFTDIRHLLLVIDTLEKKFSLKLLEETRFEELEAYPLITEASDGMRKMYPGIEERFLPELELDLFLGPDPWGLQ